MWKLQKEKASNGQVQAAKKVTTEEAAVKPAAKPAVTPKSNSVSASQNQEKKPQSGESKKSKKLADSAKPSTVRRQLTV